MRALPLLVLVTLSLALAGCSKPSNPPPDSNASTTTSTTTPTGNVTTTPTTPTMPTAPKEVKSGTTDFTQNTPAQPLAAIPITIDPGYRSVTLNVTFSCASAAPACVAANGVTVKAAGISCTIPDGPVTAAIPCAKTGSATEGASKVEFAGNGVISAKWSITES